jgi:dTDP-4-dehydrorhamnose reductase
MRVLVTGATGFIGSHLLYCAPPEHELWGVNLNLSPQNSSARLLRFDLRDPIALSASVRGVRPAIVIHTAGSSRLAFCEDHPTAAWEMTSMVTETVVEECRHQKIRLIFLSSDMVFDGSSGNYCETDAPHPINFYGTTKLAAEDRVLSLNNLGVILRINLTYGRPLHQGHSFSEEILQTIHRGEKYPLFEDQRRSFLSVRNLCQAIWEIAGNDFSGLLHIGGSESCNRYQFGLKLAERTGGDSKLLIRTSLKTVPRLNLQPPDNTFDISLAAGILKTCLLDLDEGLALEYPEAHLKI